MKAETREQIQFWGPWARSAIVGAFVLGGVYMATPSKADIRPLARDAIAIELSDKRSAVYGQVVSIVQSRENPYMELESRIKEMIRQWEVWIPKFEELAKTINAVDAKLDVLLGRETARRQRNR